MEKRSFLVYMDNFSWVRKLSDEQKGRLFYALFCYAMENCETGIGADAFLEDNEFGMENDCAMAFGFMADSICRDNRKWLRAKEAKEARKAEKTEKERGDTSSVSPPVFEHEQNCKPGSVFDSHLSRPAVADRLKPPPENGRASHMFSHGVAPNRVYSIGQSPADG